MVNPLRDSRPRPTGQGPQESTQRNPHVTSPGSFISDNTAAGFVKLQGFRVEATCQWLCNELYPAIERYFVAETSGSAAALGKLRDVLRGRPGWREELTQALAFSAALAADLPQDLLPGQEKAFVTFVGDISVFLDNLQMLIPRDVECVTVDCMESLSRGLGPAARLGRGAPVAAALFWGASQTFKLGGIAANASRGEPLDFADLPASADWGLHRALKFGGANAVAIVLSLPVLRMAYEVAAAGGDGYWPWFAGGAAIPLVCLAASSWLLYGRKQS